MPVPSVPTLKVTAVEFELSITVRPSVKMYDNGVIGPNDNDAARGFWTVNDPVI